MYYIYDKLHQFRRERSLWECMRKEIAIESVEWRHSYLCLHLRVTNVLHLDSGEVRPLLIWHAERYCSGLPLKLHKILQSRKTNIQNKYKRF